MKRYPEYKECGVEWVGEIPYHWRLSRIDSLFFRRREKNTNIISNNILSVLKDRGVIRYEDKGNIGNKVSHNIENYQLVYAGDIVVNNMNVTIGSVGRSDQFGALSGIYIVLAPKGDNVDMGYYEYVFKIKPFQKSLIQISSGLMEIRESLNFIQFKVLKLPTPPLSEQTQIAAFLDRKTRQIDDLIRIKDRRIELLQEQRLALINQVVTKGLDPNVEMKPSGVEWIGEIPAHWEVKQIKQIARFIGGYSEFGSESYTDRGIPIFRIGDVTQCIKMEQVKRVLTQQVKRLKHNELCHGDTLIVMIGRRAGESTYYAFDYPSILSTQVAGLRATEADSKLLFYFIHSASFLNAITPLFFGATRDNISKTALMRVKIPFPPNREQAQIVDFLDHKTGQIDELIVIEGRKIEILKEYRQSLISEVVTGKIDVRNEV